MSYYIDTFPYLTIQRGLWLIQQISMCNSRMCCISPTFTIKENYNIFNAYRNCTIYSVSFHLLLFRHLLASLTCHLQCITSAAVPSDATSFPLSPVL